MRCSACCWCERTSSSRPTGSSRSWPSATWPEANAQGLARQFGWPIGSTEFRRAYLVRADDRQAAEWLAGPTTQQWLLTHLDPDISLTTNGADILAWSDYGGSHLSRVEDYDITTVDAMLDVLHTVELQP